MIDLRNIETFFWASSLGGFRAAAEKLNTTQPTISQRIASLESDLGVRLFERDARGVTLTPKGRELLPHAERMLRMRQDLIEVARARDVMVGTIRIGVSETIVHTWLYALIEHMHAAHPALMFEIEVDTSQALRAQLLSHQLDLAFLMGPIQEANVENLPLCQYPLAWVASPRLKLGPEPVPLARVAAYPIITHASSTWPYRLVRELLVQEGVVTPRMYGSGSLNTIVRMVRDGIGACVIAPVVISRELESGELREFRVQAELPDLVFTASWVRGADNRLRATVAQLGCDFAQAHSAALGDGVR